jgi:NDP-4-keto-2,6-dideoxyhexose 3-C-methyltransferase
MLTRNSYDTVCHEHTEYYALQQIYWMTSRCGLKIVDVEFNDVNGGSFSFVAARIDSSYPESPLVQSILASEMAAGLNGLDPYLAFQGRTEASRHELQAFVAHAAASGRRVACLGASTKGNVLLQYCGFTSDDIEAVGEVNPDKFGCLTPGSLIPIVDETQLLREEPDDIIVLPWHFRDFFVNKYEFKKANLVFPLPTLTSIPPKS